MDELEKLQTWWTDPEYILTFFKKNKQLLANGIYGDYTVNEAAVKTLQDAQTLFDQLYDIAEKGFSDPTDNLSQFFYPLHESDKKQLLQYEQCKAYGIKINDGWLRLYAIRLDANTFVITGGGIKLVQKMQDVFYLNDELEKLKTVQQYLKDEGILDVDDLK